MNEDLTPSTPPTLEPVDLPPVVYVPTMRGPDGELRVEYQQLPDGRLGLFSYSAIDRLHDWYRPDSPWLLVDVADLQVLFESAPYDVLYLDVRLMSDAAA